MTRPAGLLVLALLGACTGSGRPEQTPPNTLIIGIDVSGSFRDARLYEDAVQFLEALGLRERGLPRLVRACHALLNLRTFFSVASGEVRAWDVPAGTRAPQAAGRIHTDMERGFIRAEVIAYEDLIACGSLAAARERGLLRLEGRDYEVRDGDVISFRFAV